MKTGKISNQTQADKAGPGLYKVTGAVGLFLKIGDTGKGSYFYRYRLDDRRREMGLGARGDISLAEARDAVGEYKTACKKGVDPIEARRRERAENLARSRTKPGVMFELMVEAYLKAHSADWKHKYARAVWVNPLRNYAIPVIGKLTLDQIEIHHIVEIMERAEKAGAPELARRVRARIERVLNRAIALVGDARRNPADGKLVGALHPMKRKGERPHFRAVDLDAAPKVFKALRAQAETHSVFAAWCFMILTALGCVTVS